MSLKGNTTDFPLDVLLRLLADQKKTGELVLRGAQGEGALGLADGRVVTAVYGDEPPIPALGAVFDLSQADFEFTPWNDAPAANLEGDLQDNLRKADEHKKWLASVREVIPHDRLRFRLSERAADQGAVTFTSDRWRLVLAVNGQRDVDDLATHLQIDRNAALNVLSGLVRDGVIDTVEPPAGAEPMQTWSAPVSAAPEPAPEAPPAREPPPPPVSREDWSAALLRETPPAPAPEPPPAPEPTFSTPAPAAPEPPAAAPEPPAAAPEPRAPVADQWVTNPEPAAEWTAPSATPASAPPASDAWSGARDAAPAGEWSAPPPASTPAEPAAPAQDWTPAPVPAPAQPVQDWAPPAPVEPEPARAAVEPESAPLDDRLAALFGSAPAETASPSTDEWSAPAPTDQWSTPAPAADEWTAPAAPGAAEAEDPRLAAMRLPPPIQTAPAAPTMPSNEWAPPPAEPAAAKKRGLFGFGKREEPAAARTSGAAVAEPGAGTRIGQLAAFSNALLNEYNSGKYGKARVDDRMPSLLMRVDEQADPIDRPLPVVDDRLDVQAMERVSLAESQAVPYLAFLVTTIYGDAEKAFGRDKAKKGYKAAHVQLFGGDASALAGPELAGKLPKV